MDCIGSNVNSYVQSIDKLISFTNDRCQTSTSANTAAPVTTTNVNSAKVDQFIALVGLSRPAPFNVAALLALVDDSVENAVALYFDAGVTSLVSSALHRATCLSRAAMSCCRAVTWRLI